MSEQHPVGMGSGSDPYGQTDPSTAKGYALSGKIMLTAIIVLFAVVLVMVFLHIYARWYLLRQPHNNHSRRRRRRTTTHHLVFYVEPNEPSSIHPQIPNNNNFRLDPSILKTLPTFTFTFTPSSNPSDDENYHECAVCLSEFEQGELARLLPLCGHTFHVDCIDMWFQSHSNCPLCRSPVVTSTPPPTTEGDSSSVEIVVVEDESSRNLNINATSTSFTSYSDSSAAPPSSDLPCASFSDHAVAAGQGVGASSSSFGGRRKVGSGVSVEIPARSTSFSFTAGSADDPSPASSLGYSRSPTSRLLSIRRILSREKRPLPSPTGLPSSSSSSSADFVVAMDQPPPTTPKRLQGSDKL